MLYPIRLSTLWCSTSSDWPIHRGVGQERTNSPSFGIRVCSSLFNGIYSLSYPLREAQLVLHRYGSDLTPDQKDALFDVIRVRPHASISAEIRREIINSVERGALRPGDDEDVKMH